MKVVVTGGAGFIGFHLACHHAARADQVVLLDNLFKAQGAPDPELQALLTRPGVRLIRQDLTEPLRGIEEALDGADVVYHLAAINGTQLFYDIPYQVARTNCLATLTLLDALTRHPPKRLLYSSSSEVYAGAEPLGLLRIPTDERIPVVFAQPTEPRFSYGTSKFMGEVLCQAFARQLRVPCTVVRYHNIYGPRMGTRHVIPEFIERVLRREDPFDLFGGHETRAFCYVDDAVEATVRVAEAPARDEQLVHVGNPHEEIRIVDLARLVMELMGAHAELRERGSRSGSVSRRCPDITRLKALTGFEPAVNLREGLARTVAWYANAPDAMPAGRGAGSRA